MEMSKTKISKRMKKKTNSKLVETILLCKKHNQLELGKVLSGPRRRISPINLDEIEKGAKEGETVIFPGKVLGTGTLNKKVKLVALDFSKSAEEKLRKNKVEFKSINEALKDKSFKGRLLK